MARTPQYPGFELPQHQAAVNAEKENPRPAHRQLDELEMAIERLDKVLSNLDARLQPVSSLPETPTPAKPMPVCEPYAPAAPLTEKLGKFTRAIQVSCDRVNQMESHLDI